MKSSPRVRSGKQYRADRSGSTPQDHNLPRALPEVFRQHPGPGHRHVLRVRHVREFLSILPDWPAISVGLNTVLLARERPLSDGFHRPGLVAIRAAPRRLSQHIANADYVAAHRRLFDRLGVPVEPTVEGSIVHFTERTLRGFQLLHVLLHELGHHHDRMTTRSQRRASRGESFAELYANTHADYIWSKYESIEWDD